MTNFENLKKLTLEEMAWFLMAYSDACRTCVHKQVTEYSVDCGKPEDLNDSCISGTKQWLNRETEKDGDDMFMFGASRHNVLVDKNNAELGKE